MAETTTSKRKQDLDVFLGTGAHEAADNLGITRYSIGEAFAAMHRQVDKVKNETGSQNAAELSQYLIEKIHDAERELTRKFAFGERHTVSGLEKTIAILRDQSSTESLGGFFLRDEAIHKLLVANPPEGLLEGYEASNTDSLIRKIGPRTALALTRHTEDKDWQHRHHQLLHAVVPSDFEEREIGFRPVDSTQIASVAEKNGHHMKPWGISHNKEAGVIMFFTANPPLEIRAENVLQSAVFLHYQREITHASNFFRFLSDSDNFGRKLSALVSNNRRSFGFLKDKNVYDETLYWDEAIELLGTTWCPEHLGVFRSLSACACTDGLALTSLNFVDLLWQLSLDQISCDYHFKQSFWITSVKKHAELDDHAFQSILLQNLEKNDFEITDRILRRSNGSHHQ